MYRNRRRVGNGLDGTSRRYVRRLLSSEPVSSFPKRKRYAGLQFEARVDFDFPPRPPLLNRPEKPLRFFWTFPAIAESPMRIRTALWTFSAGRFAAAIQRQLLTNLIPTYQAARTKTPVR